MQAQHTSTTHFLINPMKRYKAILTTTLFFLFLATVSLFAQPVTFSVNMEHAFLQAGDKVVVRGNIPGLGNWEVPGQLMLKKERNRSVYSAKLNPKRSTTSSILYKFVILRQDGSEEWEERGNRVLDPENTDPVWFDDRNMPGVQQTVVQVTFLLDLTDHSMNGIPAEGVALMGAHAPLSFELETGRTEMSQTGDGLWETTVAFPFGTPLDIPFKFAWLHDGEWMWEWRPGHTNHVFLIEDSETQQTVQLAYNVQLPGVVPVAGSSGQVDNYEAVLASLPSERRNQSRYTYEQAMEQLRSGEMEAATATYARYKAGHPGGEEIDDFHYRMVHHLQQTQGEAVASAYLEARMKEESIPERQAYYGYLKGELALNKGKMAEARRHFMRLENDKRWELASEYARQGLVHSYLTDSDPDSVMKGVSLLEAHAARAPQAERRKYLVRLERAYRAAELPEARRNILTELANTGSPAQQAKGNIELAKVLLRQGQPSEALGLLDKAEFGRQVPKGMDIQRVRLMIEAYYELEMHEELATLYTHYQEQWPEDAYAKRLEKLNEQALKKLGTSRGTKSGLGLEVETATSDSTGN